MRVPAINFCKPKISNEKVYFLTLRPICQGQGECLAWKCLTLSIPFLSNNTRVKFTIHFFLVLFYNNYHNHTVA